MCEGPQSEGQLTLELYAFGEDGDMDSNEECHLEGKEGEVDLQLFLGRRGQDLRQACCQRSSKSQLKDPLLSAINASVDMFGERNFNDSLGTVVMNRQQEADMVQVRLSSSFLRRWVNIVVVGW